MTAPATNIAMPEFIHEPLPISSLRNDKRYQRDIDPDWVSEIIRTYRKELFEAVAVGMREDSSLFIVNGQHRVAAARQMGWTHVPCQIFESTGYEHEALIYELLQTQRANLSVGQRFKARLSRHEPVAVEINAIVESLGLRLGNGPGQTTLQCYTHCEKAYGRGNLRDALTVIIQAWDFDLVGFRGYFVDTVSVFLSTLHAENFELDMKRVVDSMAKLSPSKFLREVAITRLPHATFMRILLDKYNTGLRTGRIVVDDPAALIDSVKSRLAAMKRDPEEMAANVRKAAQVAGRKRTAAAMDRLAAK